MMRYRNPHYVKLSEEELIALWKKVSLKLGGIYGASIKLCTTPTSIYRKLNGKKPFRQIELDDLIDYLDNYEVKFERIKHD